MRERVNGRRLRIELQYESVEEERNGESKTYFKLNIFSWTNSEPNSSLLGKSMGAKLDFPSHSWIIREVNWTPTWSRKGKNEQGLMDSDTVVVIYCYLIGIPSVSFALQDSINLFFWFSYSSLGIPVGLTCTIAIARDEWGKGYDNR